MSPVEWGADAVVSDTPKTRARGARANAVLPAILRSCAVLVAALREIFDESAYQRFLDRMRLEPSAKAYAMFRKENEQAKSRRPKCC
jgi:hypothetical protein